MFLAAFHTSPLWCCICWRAILILWLLLMQHIVFGSVYFVLKWDDSSPSRAYSAVTLDDVSHWDFAVIYGFSVILHIEISLRHVMFSLFCCSIWYQSLTCWATAEWKKSVISINVDHCYRCRQGGHIALSYNWKMTRIIYIIPEAARKQASTVGELAV